ncbi:diacylglycerol/lipid kinase family protein [Desulfobacterota bacterium M19]
MRLKFIANPAAGSHQTGIIERAAGYMRRQGAEVEVFITAHAGHAAELAADMAGFERLVVAGGDGTVNEVINGMMPEPRPMAVIPLGTANVLALECALPENLAAQCALAVTGEPRPATLGRADGRYFLLMAGAGMDAAAVDGVNLGLKKLTGKGAYFYSAFKVWLRQPVRDICCRLEDGTVFSHLSQVVVCNSRLYGGPFCLAPAASIFSPRFEVVILPFMGRFSLLICLLSLFRGRIRLPGRILTTARLTVSGQGRLQLDGEAAGKAAVRIEACPALLPLII